MDIVERLRKWNHDESIWYLLRDAADEVEFLREVLRLVMINCDRPERVETFARAALEEGE